MSNVKGWWSHECLAVKAVTDECSSYEVEPDGVYYSRC